MIDTERRIEISRKVQDMTNESLLEMFKGVDRKSRALVGELASYQSEDTFDTVKELSELEYERRMIVDRIIGKAVS